MIRCQFLSMCVKQMGPLYKSIDWQGLKLEEALLHMEEMLQPPSVDILTLLLLRCKQEHCVSCATRVHSYLHKFGLEAHETLGNHLVPFLVEVGNLCDAQVVLDKLVCRNEHSYNSLIAGFAKCGDSHQALSLYQRMWADSIRPNGFTYVAILKALSNLKDVKRGCDVHYYITCNGLERDLFVGSSLIDMYLNCNLLVEAQEVFDRLGEHDTIAWNALMAGYYKHGLFQEAWSCYKEMQAQGTVPSQVTYVCILRVCGELEAVSKGQEVHSELVAKGLDCDVVNGLIEMYANCVLVDEAEEVFGKLVYRGTASWTALATGYCKCKMFHEVLSCFEQMQRERVAPGIVAFLSSLKACGILVHVQKGQETHAEVVKKGLLESPLVGTTLVNMYANCGLVREAQVVFNNLSQQDIVSWTALIAGYAKRGFIDEAADCFTRMQEEDVPPDTMCWNALIEGYAKHGHDEEALDCVQQMTSQGLILDSVTYIFGLKACSSLGSRNLGFALHGEIAAKGLLEKTSVVGNALIDFYTFTGLLAEAIQVFYKMPVQDVVSWTSLMAGYTKHGLGQEALYLFKQMHLLSVSPSIVALVCVLKACADVMATEEGQEIHNEVVTRGLLESDIVGNALVDMYANCGLLFEAHKVFDKISVHDNISWTALLGGYAKHGHVQEARNCFEQMQSEGILPDAVAWSALIAGYAKHDCGEEALKCLEEMRRAGISPDCITLASSLKACGSVRASDMGREINAEVARKGLLEGDLVIGNALIDMYGMCGDLAEARDVFDKLPVRDAVSWTSLIAGYTKHGHGEEAVSCFRQMTMEACCSPDVVTFICVLKACGSIGATDKGEEIHAELARNGLLERNPVVAKALLDMYTDSGLPAKAQDIFDKLPVQDALLWTALIAGYAKNGHSEEALHCFQQMQLRGIFADASSWHSLIIGYAHGRDTDNLFNALNRMNGAAAMNPCVDMFISALTACSHAGLVDLGQSYFDAISRGIGLTPSIEHHGCMLDLFGRSGQLGSATILMERMPFQPNLVVWHSILGACRKWAYLELARWAFEHAIQLDKTDIGAHVCMSNMYAEALVMQEDVSINALKNDIHEWPEAEGIWSSCSL